MNTAAVASAGRRPGMEGAGALIALAAGLAIGATLAAVHAPTAERVVQVATPIGTLWVNAIRMTVIPLVMSLLVTGVIGSSDTRAVARLGVRSVLVFLALLIGLASIVALVAPLLYAGRSADPATAALLAATTQASAVPPEIPTFASWLTGLVPANPVKAAVDGAMLPLIVFTVSFALALRFTPRIPREAVAAFFRGVADAMLVLVRWVLSAAPLGVGALALTLGARLGVGAAGAVGFYLVVHGSLLIVAVALLYAVAWAAGRVPLRVFARAAVPAQAVAMSTRSSLAALPAMLAAATARLGIRDETAAFVLPFAVSVFRLNLAVSWTVGALFLAQLYGVTFGTVSVLTVAASAVAMSFSVPGIPSGSLFIIAPILPLVGLPVEGVGILIALDVLPDVLKTLLNVTGHLTAAVLVTREVPPD